MRGTKQEMRVFKLAELSFDNAGVDTSSRLQFCGAVTHSVTLLICPETVPSATTLSTIPGAESLVLW